MNEMTRFNFLRVFLVGWVFLASCHQKCTYFKFTGLTDNVFQVDENTEASLTFEVRNDNCTGPKNVIVKVSQKNKTGGRYRVLCQIFPGEASPCPNITKSGPYQYQLKKIFDRRDNVTWLWSAINGSEDVLENAEIDFFVLYPSNVTSLHWNSTKVSNMSIAGHNNSVNIVCKWDQGNPPVTARLLDRHGVEMEGSIYSSGQINYTFPAVSCHDAGLIRCEAPGASHNETATLLVKCPPTFNNPMMVFKHEEPNQNITMTFPFMSHTTNFTNCTLMKVNASQNSRITEQQLSRPEDCLSFADVTGTPPDLVLTVRLDNVSKEDEGQWRLTLTNDAGQGQMNFCLDATQNESEQFTSTDTSQQTQIGDEFPTAVIVFTVGGSAFAVFVAIALAILVVCGRHGRRDDNFVGVAVYRAPRQGNGYQEQNNQGVIPNPYGADGDRVMILQNNVHECAGNAMPDVVFVPADIDAPANGPRNTNKGQEEPDYVDIDDENEASGKHPQANGHCSGIPCTSGSARKMDTDVCEEGACAQPAKFCGAAAFPEMSTEEDTYVPISDILARKRCKNEDDTRSAKDEVEDTGSYSSLNFNKPRRPIRRIETRRASCLYSKLADMQIKPEDRDEK